jgi:hypothetical protein
MPPSKIFTQYGLFPGSDIQVTSGTPKQARSESIIAINPANPTNLIAASKKFSNPKTYRFTIGIRVSFDGGNTWLDSELPILQEWGDMVGLGGKDASAGMTDPAVVFDAFGNTFLVGEPIKYQPDGVIDTIGMYVYKSNDGGLHWSAPTPIHVGDTSDDKSWIACDNNPPSPYYLPGSSHYGNIYIAWGAASPLRFARSTDQGAHWKGVGSDPPGSKLADFTYAPEISVGLDGTVHIVWHPDGGTTIEYMRSTDGGETFEPQKTIVTDVHSLRGSLPEIDSWPHFPGATFRVITVATGCGFGTDPLAKNFAVAWSDFREGAARIYYRTSSNAGASFDGPMSGQPLLSGRWTDPGLHHFHPQIIATGSGVIGCAYYEYGAKGGNNLIDVKLSASFDQGQTFSNTTVITDKPWDPKIDAPNSHGDPNVTFIGEYFGLDADSTRFGVLWTDTRTGVQELFYDRVNTERYAPPAELGGIFAEILLGVVQDGGGVVIINGHIVRIPPRGPEFDLVQALVAVDAAQKIGGSAGRALTRSAYNAIGTIARAAGKSSLQR